MTGVEEVKKTEVEVMIRYSCFQDCRYEVM
jgi:hypothetical protein